MNRKRILGKYDIDMQRKLAQAMLDQADSHEMEHRPLRMSQYAWYSTDKPIFRMDVDAYEFRRKRGENDDTP